MSNNNCRDKSIMLRWMRAAVGIITLICLGLIYAWSVFVQPLESEFGWVRAQTSMTFTICMSAFCVGCIFAGYLIRKIPPRVVMIVAACCVAFGFLSVSQISTLGGLYVCYGIFCGLGVGIGYNSILSSILKWFPDKTGILSGILLMGFGFGGSILGSLAVSLMAMFGWRMAFKVLGIVLAIVIVLSTFVLRPPRMDELQILSANIKVKITEQKDYSTREMLRTSSFYSFFFWDIMMSAIGLSVISNAAPLAQSMTSSLVIATFVAGLVSIFNGIGRFIFGFILDGKGSKFATTIISSGLLISSIVMALAIYSEKLVILILAFVLTGLAFGGVTPTQSTYTLKVFGSKNYSNNFSIVNICLFVASFTGPYLMGVVSGVGGYRLMSIWFIGFAIAGLVLKLLIRLQFDGNVKNID